MEKINQVLIVILILFACNNDLITAQSNDVLEIVKVDGIILDGKVDEAIWYTIEPVPMVQYSPNAGAAPTEKTEIRFAYDDDFFYVSLKAFDSDPSGIRGNSLYRDRLGGSDHLEIVLDCYNDNKTAFVFNTISTGVRTDGAISNDATGGTISSSSWFNRDFNTFWDTEVTRDDEGWYAETRIPFTSLRFQNIDGNVIMGLTVQRKIARKLERLIYPNIPPEQDWAFLRPSLAQKILIKGIQPTKSVYIAPYVVGGIERRNLLKNAKYELESDPKFDIGGDVKFSVTNNVTMDFTVNTDFAQAEADDQLINLSRFSLFFPEKRQFFQESASTFDFKTGGLSRMFFSRRIGLTDGGVPVPILGGARLVGRFNTWDFGALNMQTRSAEDLGAENFGVVRMKRRFLNEFSTIGGILTSRRGNGNSNIAYGVDALICVFKDDFLTANWSQTFDDNELADIDNSDNVRLTLELNRRRRNGFGYNVGAIYSGSNYKPGIGFVDREDFKFGTANISNTWLYPEGTRFISQSVDFTSSVYLNNTVNERVSSEIGLAWSFSNRTQDAFKVSANRLYERLYTDFKLADFVAVPSGEYNFNRLSASYRMAGEKILRAGIEVETGSFYDGWLNTLRITPSWFVSKHIELSLTYSYNQARFKERGESLDIHIARLRVGTAFNSKVSINSFVQYSSSADIFSANVRFRYNIKEGNDFWIVLNEGLNTDRFAVRPVLPRSNEELVLLKYIHTFVY